MKRWSRWGLAFVLPVVSGCQAMSSSINPVITSPVIASKNAVYHIQKQSSVTFLQRTQVLSDAIADYCALQENNTSDVAQSEERRSEVEKQLKIDKRASLEKKWSATMASWMALQGQERGPQQALDQSWNIQFWPDKKNTLGRKMQALLSEPKAWSAQDISEQSVTVQGLGAIEWLVYDQSSDFSSNHDTCQTAISIGENLVNNASSIEQAWQENPWTDLSEQAWVSEYVSLMSNQLDYTMKKLSRPLAKIGHPKPYFAESWRAKQSLSNIQYNVLALQEIYFADGTGLDHLLRSQGKYQLADNMSKQFTNILSAWPEQSSLFDALQSREGYSMTLAQYNKLEYLKYLLDENVALELGIVIGFNATDGD
ncbi:iron-regulated protein A [Vibrio sp. UCD-FRSSP16_10]|uniref:imelysin family protein n=1 Tax=unclassified Vibrio TaxID=2614977 RepID=UPI0008023623|nr:MULTISPECIES: imelysin family protein [unclassified Vibrio]OBT14788.1 iron-regulated protein A [Vibrio sp. UCD-FRSSP16_30]OBT20077.1 iron-regulated protein A [Vibrio sp. UCD-FRSSP16_10]